jgi:hyperosmotically inducible periplasmic protein
MKRSFLIALTLIAIIIAPVANGLRASTIPTSFSAQQRSTQDRTMAYLVKEVRHELLMLPYYSVFDWLEFEAKPDGTVILNGQVTRPTLKSDAENVVKRIEGVEMVVNQIEVLPLSSNDDRIRRAVYRALFNYGSPLFRYGMGAVPSIHIIVKNGNVTLKGNVSSQADADIANIRARSVPGIFGVKNELAVERS